MAGKNSFTDLLCDEETKGFCFDDTIDDGEKQMGLSDSLTHLPLPCLTEECIEFMVERESEHLPKDDYLKRLISGELDISIRKMALHWMFKACAHFSFGEMCLYSAVTYFDRFLSSYELTQSSSETGGNNWAIQLAAVACLSLAAKMDEVNVPSTLDLQGAGVPKVLFEGKTIQRMEILVLNSLNWKIKAYTPCNYMDYYLRKMNDNKFPSGQAINRSLQIMLSTIEAIEFLEFRPSEIAAAVAIFVSGEIQKLDIYKALPCLIGVDKERVVKCLELIQELPSIDESITATATATTTSDRGGSLVSSMIPRSPNGVLEAACLSYKRERSVGSCSSTPSQGSPDAKRRKLDQNGGDS